MTPQARGYFITGTDTSVGKTFVTQLLLQALNQQGIRSLGMKPVAAGAEMIDGQLANDDALVLAQAGCCELPYDWINPVLLPLPVAPHIAAERARISIDLPLIQQAYAKLAVQAEVVLVEGAGGWLVPLSDSLDMSDLARCLDLPVILVVGMRLGCINHALLSVRAIQSSGLVLHGWIANAVDAQMLEYPANLLALQQRINVPLLAQIAHRADSLPPGCDVRL